MFLENFDLRLIDVVHELYAIEKYIDSIEQQIPDLIQKEEAIAYEQMKKSEYENDEAEWQITRQEYYELIEVAIPKYFWGPTIVILWAIFESAILKIANEIKSHKKLGIGLNDINGDVMDRVNLYFNQILKMPIQTRSKAWQHLRMLYVLRNAIAHANGKFKNIKSDKDVKKIHKWIKDGIGIQANSDDILFTPEFVREAHSIIFSFLDELIKKFKEQYPITIKRAEKNAG